ncbi:MAG: serine--tRNA ligase [Chthonomonas sp.]|nr:serine--tRNA ligase [Chthonomonas sp.]
MIDRNRLRTQQEALQQGFAAKNIQVDLSAWNALDQQHRSLLQEVESARAEQNKASKEIGALMAQGKRDEAEAAKSAVAGFKTIIGTNEPKLAEIEAEMVTMEQRMPNPPHADVPVAFSEADNLIVREWGERPTNVAPIPHWESAAKMGMLDLERAAKISGSGFAVYTGWGARLQRALFNFMIDHQTMTNGYREIYPPVIVNSKSLFGTAQLPKFEEDLFKIDDNKYLIPTAEVPVTNLYADEILEPGMVPMKMAAMSGCFRREAGSAGKDTRGIQRVHQFDKVELVRYALPENSYDDLEQLTQDAASILEALGLHYRVAMLCSGELSANNTKCYDLEIWSPGMEKYLEVSSCSNFEDFQARRANIRFRREAGAKPEFVHTLNGSGVACPRLFIVLLESLYKPGYGMDVPAALQPYVGAAHIPEL